MGENSSVWFQSFTVSLNTPSFPAETQHTDRDKSPHFVML